MSSTSTARVSAEPLPDLGVDLGQRFRVLVARVEQPRELRRVVAHVTQDTSARRPDVCCACDATGWSPGRVDGGAGCARSRGSAQAQKKKKPGCSTFSGGSRPSSTSATRRKQLAPQGLNLTPGVAPAAEARAIRLRIYADRDYRGTVIRWQSKARAQVQRINTVVGAVFNVRFEVESLRDWDRSHVGVPLGQPFVEELEALDDGKQVDLVVALVTPLHGVAASVHSIGYANYLSRHFVLRGMDDEQEFRAFEQEFKLISVDGAASGSTRIARRTRRSSSSCTSGGTRWA